MEVAPFFGLGVLISIALAASWTDIRARVLPNWLVGLTLVSGLVFAYFAGDLDGVLYHSFHALLALMIGFALYGFKIWGAGDGKFYAAVSVWFGVTEALALIVAITSIGLVLTVFAIIRNWGRLLSKQHSNIPYGVAIGFGAVLNLSREFLW